MKSPKWFSDTRFAAYAYRVFHNFLDDYQTVRGVLENIAAGEEKADMAQDILKQIRTVDLLAKMMLLCHRYQELGY